MGQFGELFGAPKVQKESEDDDGTGELLEPGSIDLDGGTITIRPRRKPAESSDE